jgi:hypothetical protein
MTVKTAETANDSFEVTGSGYHPEGKSVVKGQQIHRQLLDDRKVACGQYPYLATLI